MAGDSSQGQTFDPVSAVGDCSALSAARRSALVGLLSYTFPMSFGRIQPLLDFPGDIRNRAYPCRRR